MKKLSMLLVVLLAFASCSKVDTTNPEAQADQSAASVPHLFGTMLPDDPAPQTRGVSDDFKRWSPAVVQKGLTIKFLGNAPEKYKNFVKEVAKEWSDITKVNFNFVESSQNAVVRIGFDSKGYANASWAMTGTDNQTNRVQTEPTVNYANWASLSEEKKRNDVLRTFGQVLGLELEFRHPNFDPGWIRDSKGNVDTVKIQSYWDSQLSGYIGWDELKQIVLDPFTYIENISSTQEYDPKSVMTWQLPRNIANNIPVADMNAPVITELSEQDITFIQSFYGELTTVEKFLSCMEFQYSGSAPKFTVKTTKDLYVKWDATASDDYVAYKIPEGAVTPYTFTISNTYPSGITRKIVIGEVFKLESDEPLPTQSFALTRFDFPNASSATNFKIFNLNKSLTYVRINGVADAAKQTFDFTGNKAIQELYLLNIQDSKVILNGCDYLETFSTSTSLEQIKKPLGYGIPNATRDSRIVVSDPDDPRDKPLPEMWPYFPEAKHSLSNGCLTIQNCPNLRYLGLEHTRITNFNFSNLPALQLVYISSFADYIAGGGYAECDYLKNLITTLNKRIGDRGSLVIQRVMPSDRPNSFSPYNFVPMTISANNYNSIKSTLSAKNWDFFNVDGGIDMNLVSEGGRAYRVYYRYLNLKYPTMTFDLNINKYFGANGEVSDWVIWPASGHDLDENKRPYYSVVLNGATHSYRIGLKAVVGMPYNIAYNQIIVNESDIK